MSGTLKRLFRKVVAGFRLDEELCRVSIKGDVAAIKSLVLLGADVNSKKYRPLYGAIVHNQIESVRALIEAGAHVNGVDRPLGLAALLGRTDIVRVLIAAGANKDRGDPLVTAISYGHTETVRAFIEAGARVGPIPDTLFEDLKDWGFTEIAKLLKAAADSEEKLGLDRIAPRASPYRWMIRPPNARKAPG